VLNFSGEQIEGCELTDPGATIDGRSYENCVLAGCVVTVQRHWPVPAERVAIRDVWLGGCRTAGAVLVVAGATLRDVNVDRFDGPLWARFCSFERVSLRGSFRNLRIESMLPPVSDEHYSYWHNIALANDAVYAAGNRALDVSEATFDGSSMIRGIPPHLIRINSATQAVITTESLAGAREVFSDGELERGIGQQVRWMIEGTSLDHVLHVPLKSRDKGWDEEVISRVHRHGLALSS